MNHLPLISVIIPVYKAELYIADCISSLIGQTYQHLELVLVDDCGGDNSMAIAKDLLASTSLKCQYIEQPHNKGQAAARNRGIAAATGEYLYFLDSDDYIDAQCIERLYNLAQSYDADMVVGSMLRHQDGKEIFCETRFPENPMDERMDIALFQHRFRPFLGNKLVCKTAYVKHGISFREGVIFEDLLWCMEACLKLKKIVFCDAAVYHYIIHPNSTTLSKDNLAYKAESLATLLEEIWKLAKEFSVETNDDFKKFWLSYFMNAYSYAMKTDWSFAQKARYMRKLLAIGRFPWEIYRNSDPRGKLVYYARHVMPASWVLVIRGGLAERLARKKV